MPSLDPPIVLLGSDCLTGLQMARILWRRSVCVIGVADDVHSHGGRSRSVMRTEPAGVLRDDPGRWMESLSMELGTRPVVLACTDEFVWWLSDHRRVIERHADLLLPPAELLSRLGDKSRFYRFAMREGMDLPDTRFASSEADLVAATRDMRFPVYLKPPRRTREWMQATGDRKVLRIEDGTTLVRQGLALLPTVDELIVQAAVRGPDSNMYSLYFCADRESRVLAALVARKLRQWPPEIGSGSLAVEVDEQRLREQGLAFMTKLGYVGIGSLQVKRDEIDGRFYLIEINAGRATLNLPLCEASGVAMAYTYHCAAAGLPLPPDRLVTRPGSKWICWRRDVASALTHLRRGDLTLTGWLRSLRGIGWSADIRFEDPLPFHADMVRLLARILRRRRAASKRMT